MLNRSDFPEGFLFGAATAAYQIEGHSFGGAGRCHWDDFAATPGNVVRAEDGAVACDHYNLWEEDLDLMEDAGFDAYRFSTSWARVMPEGRGKANPEGLDFYDRLVDGILEREMKPFLTLYHWDLPSALADLGGWTNPDIARWFGDYTEVIAGRIGDRVASVATHNEPWCTAYLGYLVGRKAPGMKNIRAAARAMHYVLLSHGVAMERLRSMGIKNLGIVLNTEHVDPLGDSKEAQSAARRQNALLNDWYISALTGNGYPVAALRGLLPHMPEGWEDDLPQIAQPMDWLGVNYYTRRRPILDPAQPWPALADVPGDLPKNSMGWEICPEGLHSILTHYAKTYVGDLPIYVTENGMPWDDVVQNDAVHDPQRQNFIAAHMAQMKRAIEDGVNLKGFFYWSLLDNYEWAYGYEKRFGIIHVDFETMKRTPKGSYYALKEALAK